MIMDVGMPSNAESSFAQDIQRVRAKFIDSLLDRILLFETVTVAYAQTGDHEKALKDISWAAHKITGIAGSLGFPDIGEQARQIEQIIGVGVKAPNPDTMRCVAPILETFLDNLEELLDSD
jgi:HPt (histidine-containing phosphotransfer) domain-containing protein